MSNYDYDYDDARHDPVHRRPSEHVRSFESREPRDYRSEEYGPEREGRFGGSGRYGNGGRHGRGTGSSSSPYQSQSPYSPYSEEQDRYGRWSSRPEERGQREEEWDRPSYGSGSRQAGSREHGREFGYDERGYGQYSPPGQYGQYDPSGRPGETGTSGPYGGSGSYGGSTYGQPRGRWWQRQGESRDSFAGPGRSGEESYRGRGPKGYRRNDDRIKEDVCDCLTDDPGIDASNIDCKVESGEVTISGTVASRAQKRRIDELCERIPGVQEVMNTVRVAREQEDEKSSRSSSPSSQAGSPSGPGVGDRSRSSTTSGSSGLTGVRGS